MKKELKKDNNIYPLDFEDRLKWMKLYINPLTYLKYIEQLHNILDEWDIPHYQDINNEYINRNIKIINIDNINFPYYIKDENKNKIYFRNKNINKWCLYDYDYISGKIFPISCIKILEDEDEDNMYEETIPGRIIHNHFIYDDNYRTYARLKHK